MPNIKSAIKRVSVTEKKDAANISQKNDMRSAVKSARTAIENNADNKGELVSLAIKKVDKALERLNENVKIIISESDIMLNVKKADLTEEVH